MNDGEPSLSRRGTFGQLHPKALGAKSELPNLPRGLRAPKPAQKRIDLIVKNTKIFINSNKSSSVVTAAPYFVSAQLALIVTSAVLVKFGWKKDKEAHFSEPESPAVAAIPVSPELLQSAKAMPGDPIDRFAVLEQSVGSTAAGEQSGARQMGYRDDGESKQRPDEFIQSQVRERRPSGFKAPEEAPPSFEPVPEDIGYHIAAEAATNFNLDSQTVAFSGNVSLKCADFTLTCRRLVVHMNEGSQTLNKLVANGAVEIQLTGVPREEAYCSKSEEAVFDPATNTILLTGWPRINGRGREHIAATPATRMTLHTKASKLVTDGRAQTRLVFDGKDGLPGVTMGTPSAPPPPRKG